MHKVILVAGSRRGLGAFVAKRLSEEGHTVITHRRKGRARGEEVTFDGRDYFKILRAVRYVVKKQRRVDVLINCIGPYTPKRINEITEKEWRKDLEGTLHSAFFLSRAVLPFMCRQRKGTIIHIGDASAGRLKTSAVAVPYKIAKNGLITFVHALSQTCKKKGVAVYLISPGFMPNSIVKPPRGKKVLKASFEEIFRKIEERIKD